MKRYLHFVFYSFPAQLLILNVRKNKVLLACWLMLFGIVTQQIVKIFGIPYLFLDPEYVNRVSVWSLFIMGISIGGFTMAFHISCYILDSRKFTFLGGLRRPFTRFCINNSPIPFVFMLVYLLCFIRFQLKNEQLPLREILWQASGLVIGFVTIIMVMFYYLVITNQDVFKVLASQLGRGLQRRRMSRVNVLLRINDAKRDLIRVDNYFESLFRVKKVNQTTPYDNRAIIKAFDQNYLNAIIIELVVVISVLILGIFRDNAFFQIPAGASLILLFTMFVMLSGAITYWLKGWTVTISLALLFLLNYLVATEYFKSDYEAYGLDYNGTKAEYSLDKIRQLNGPERYKADKNETIEILERWRLKALQPTDSSLITVGKLFQARLVSQRKTPDKSPSPVSKRLRKPKMIFICTSGGGQRSSLWTMRSLQYTDSALNGKLMRHTSLMTGASGGLVGASFFRELCLQKTLGADLNLYDERYLHDIARDNLNAIVFSLVVNDIFFRFQQFTYQGRSYYKDRGYAFEEQLNKNTDGLLNKTLADYREPERLAQIPMLIMAPTVINDGRKLFISPQPISYMSVPESRRRVSTPGVSTPGVSTPGVSTPGVSTPGVSTTGRRGADSPRPEGPIPEAPRPKGLKQLSLSESLQPFPESNTSQLSRQKVLGIEFSRFFENQDAQHLRFLSALRMSATFPYITPNVKLPSEPAMEIMDAGLSDNFGVTDAVRFMYVFKDWIAENTSGVIILSIRDTPKDQLIEKTVQQSLFQKIFTPIGSLYANWEQLQDINNDNCIEFAQAWFKGPIDRVELEYIPRAHSLSLNSDNTILLSDSTTVNNVEGASLSWHLTEFEKASIRNAIFEPRNQQAIRKLEKLLKE